LIQMENIPACADYPAPWKLSGKGYILAVKMPSARLNCSSILPEDLAKTLRGCLAYIMFVDYESSNAGPYQELLYIPGSFQFKESRRLSITKIYVSTWESVVNGRKNWGIPKERCDFSVNYGGERDHVQLYAADGKAIAELVFRQRKIRLPVNTSWLPARWRTLSQLWDGHEYTYTPSAIVLTTKLSPAD